MGAATRRGRGAARRAVATPARVALDCGAVTSTLRVLAVCLALVVGWGASARAEPPLAALADPAAAPAADPYVSPLRQSWRDEIARDPELKADIEAALRLKVHKDESAAFARNNRHVVLAYVAIWVLTAGFLGALWLRQGRLRAELARLEGELARAERAGPP